MSPLSEKKEKLTHILTSYRKLLIAYSGGVDSALLLHTAYHTLGENCLGIIADSPSLPRTELEQASAFAKKHHLPLRIIKTQELENPDYSENPKNRCYFCKHELFEQMLRIAETEDFPTIAYGENTDDATDTRPGRQAASKFHITAPLAEAGLTKSEIRQLAREAHLEVSEKIASPCLASRILHHTPVTPEKLRQVELAETFLHSLGFEICRVRHHETHALIQLSPDDLPRLESEPDLKPKITAHLATLNFPETIFADRPYTGASLR